MKSSLRSNGLFLAIIGVILFLYLVYQRPIEGFQGTSGNSVAIITANFGNYDSLKDPNVNNANMVDWYCFTDNTDTKSEIWNVIDTPYHLQNEREYYSEYKNSYRNITDPKIRNMMAAKYYKIKAHEIDILKKYRYYVWVDGSITLQPESINNTLELINMNYDLISFKHSARTTVQEEVALSVKLPKYLSQNVDKQYELYKSDGFPDDSGLFECGLFVRKNIARINALFDMWWLENLKNSFQDQVSLPYCLWKTGIRPDYIIMDSIFSNEKFSKISVDSRYDKSHHWK